MTQNPLRYIYGNIKSIGDSDSIKKSILDAWTNNKQLPIEIYIKESFIITSSVIGNIVKFTSKDKMNISIYINSDDLYEMMDSMNLIEVLNVRKAQL